MVVTVVTPVYLTFGTATQVVEAQGNFVAPRAGTITDLYASIIALVGGPVTVTVRLSAVCNGPFISTPITFTAPIAGCYSASGAVAIAPGDRISVQVSVPLAAVTVAITAGLAIA